jgi:hypothetical protein
MLTGVLVLYGIYVLCTVALVTAVVLTARHIVRHRRATRSHAEHPDEPV